MLLLTSSKDAQLAVKTPNRRRKPKNEITDTIEYCWAFEHPKYGWCGGHDDDRWTENRNEMLSCMSFCPYKTKLLTRTTKGVA